ncbi:MAG: hypothetical protein DMG40_18505 [Acidobacteria bacterium]|nr:MAG: hypothetical protein DMG40_18505 [Acidobacteriota bacterium]
MKLIRSLLGTLLWLSFLSASPGQEPGQERKEANPVAAPPNLLVLVQQQVQPGKAGERRKLVAAISRACDRFDAPSFWIDLQSLSGAPQTLTLDPFDSFEQLQQAHSGWKQFYAAHSDLAQSQGEIDSLVTSERTIVAVRRDDLGAPAENIDLSEARFMRVLEVRLFPGHQGDFAESMTLWSQARSNMQEEVPWIVYQAKEGTSAPTFFVFLPLSELKAYDDLLSEKVEMLEGNEGESIADRLMQIAREAYASTESNLYVVRPETSHVPKDFASNEADFWRLRTEAEAKPEVKPSVSHTKKKP